MTTMTKKYELLQDNTITTIDGIKLYRIRALIDIPDRAKAGDLGGYVECEANLLHERRAWVYSDARVFGNDAIVWFSKVGSANGTLTCYAGKNNTLLVTRGCFSGTDAEFLKAVEKRHGDSKIGHEYRMLIEVARSRIGLSESV